MTKITVSADCGNSPRKLFLKDLNIAFAKGDTAFVIDHMDHDIVWELVGDKNVRGKAEFAEALKQAAGQKKEELTIRNIITHGKEAAVNGEMLLTNGEKYAFCDIYTFKGAQGNTIKSIASYLIAIK